ATVTTSSITEWGSGSSGSLGYDGKQTGSGIEADPYLLYTAGDLAKIATYNAADVYFKLMEDIDLGGTSSGQNLIGDNNFTFYGNLDGNDMTISGLSLTGSSSNTAIFANSSGTIENLRVADCTISSSSNYTAAIVASNSGKITNCHVSGTISSDSNYTAAITGYSSGGSISDCTVSASVGGESNYTGGIAGRISGGSISSCHASGEVNGTYTVGGVVGYVSSSCAISDCSATGSVTGSNSSVGGVAGTIDNSSSATKCTASGKVSGTECVGGVVGKLYQECTVTDCSATGSVTGSNSSVGGVVGWVQYKCSISGSSASGKVSGTECVGGVVGYNVYKTSDDDISTITGCYATGDVGGTSYVGGVVGMNEGHVTECYYTTGTVTGTTTSIGGVAGQNGNSTYHGVLYRCYNSGSVSGKGMVGGVVGYQPEGETMSCYNLGDITNTATSNTALTGNNTGGVVGHCDAYTYVIGGCSGGSVTASDTSGCGCIGGIAGSSNSGTELIGCYSTAELILLSGVTQNMTTSVQYFNSSNCSGISVGGVVGYLHLTGFRYSIIDDSYWLTNTRTSRVYAICMSSSTLSPDTTITDSKAKSAGELNSETLALTLNTALTSIVPGAYDDPTTITAFANSPLSYATSSAGDSSYPYLKLITND
ncbi:MAG: GLUG motif-containing protein, partial [Rikenellaceae bacterium]